MTNKIVNLRCESRSIQVNVFDLFKFLRTELRIDGRLLGSWTAMGILSGSWSSHLSVYSQFLRFQGNVVKVRGLKTSLANRTGVMGLKPEHNTVLAELMATNGQDTDGEGGLTNDTHSLLIGLGISFLQMYYWTLVSQQSTINQKTDT